MGSSLKHRENFKQTAGAVNQFRNTWRMAEGTSSAWRLRLPLRLQAHV